MRCWFLVVLLAVGVSMPLSAQAPASQPERRTFAVSVLDKDGNAVHGLTAANFRGTYRGQPVRILSATEDSSPRRIALLFDTSAGMGDKRRREYMGVLGEIFITQLAPPHSLLLYTFSEEPVRHSQLSNDPEVLLEAFRKPKPVRGSTALYDALLLAIQELSPKPHEDILCVITDGIDNSSVNNFDTLQKTVAGTAVRVIVILLEPLRPTGGMRGARREMVRLADLSGGFLVQPKEDAKKIPDLLSQLRERIQHVYRVEVEFPEGISKPQEWTLQVVDAEGAAIKDHEVAYPRRLVSTGKK